jgi:hypothetical protein
MACGTSLTASRKKTGFVRPKGYKAISFAKWDSSNLIVNTVTGVVTLPTSITTTKGIYRFEVKNTADNFIETFTKDLVTMTGQFAGAGTFALTYCDRITNLKDAQALIDCTWNVFFEGNDGTIIVAGCVNGADIMTVVESTDAQGFLFTLATTEPTSAYTLTGAGITAYNSGIVTAV